MAITISGSGIVEANLADDAVTLAKMASGTDGEVITYDASGNPTTVSVGTTGHVLTSTGVGSAPTMQASAVGGITTASQWRITTTFSGDANPIASNWEEADAPTGFGVLGSSVTQSGGIFTFPSTGYWLILLQMRFQANSATNYANYVINTTTDNSTYEMAALASAESAVTDRCTAICHYLFDVTSTSLCKCNAQVDQLNASNETSCSTADQHSGLTFIRLGDT
jgi:hypothetical protein